MERSAEDGREGRAGLYTRRGEDEPKFEHGLVISCVPELRQKSAKFNFHKSNPMAVASSLKFDLQPLPSPLGNTRSTFTHTHTSSPVCRVAHA